MQKRQLFFDLMKWMAVLFLPLMANAHPVVSTDINRHATIGVARDGITVEYIYEMLEIAAVNEARKADIDGDGTASDVERDIYVEQWRSELTQHLSLTLNGREIPFVLQSAQWTLGPAPFGLNTWKLSARLSAPASINGTIKVDYRDMHRPDEAGWKEIVLEVKDRLEVRSSTFDSNNRSKTLTDFKAMSELANPEQREASVTVRSHTAPAAVKKQPTRIAVVAPAPPEQSVPAVAPAQPAALTPPVSPWQHYAWPFFRLGMYHIAIGWDHLAFLLGLMLFRQSLRRLALVITAFTLAHSFTLGCAALGWVNPPGRIVEALIALSIAYVGWVSLRHPGVRHGPFIAFGFGLIHGFGFAGALAESLGDIDGKSWLFALAGFNIGIEVFQLALVALAYPVLMYADRFHASKWLRALLSSIVIVLGLFWTVQRTIA